MKSMKRYLILFAALSVLFAFSGAASAFTLAEHEKNIEKYVQALNKLPEVVKTYCEMDGTLSERSGALGGEDSVRYVQAENDFAVELRPVGGVIQLATMNPAFKLPDGSGVGDPIERVMKAALIPGDYRREVKNGLAHHIWIRDGKMTLVTEGEAKIVAIIFFNTIKMKGVTVNDAYAQTLAQARDAEAAAAASAPGGDEPAADEDGWNYVTFQSGEEDENRIFSQDENFRGAAIYKERSLKSERVATLKTDTEVVISGYYARQKTASTDPRFKEMRWEVWANLIKPVSGWVVVDELALWYGDALFEYGLFDGIDD
ncbi:MAG: hypothetical protein LBS53_04740 [Synergistaceae bacterium]|jgi:hypothetical protein|nr:hypothetical protein [Synergistaceae bacterium]